MKLSEYTIPYPILGIEGDFNDQVMSSSAWELGHTGKEYVIRLSFHVDDNGILDLVHKKKACFACEVDCSKTFYRRVFEYPEPSFEISIPKVSLGGNVHLFFSVVVKDDIVDYKNENFNNRFFEGYKFNLSKGHMLAYLGEGTFNADIKYNELNSLGSIVDVKTDIDSSFTYFDFGGDMITIYMPQSEFDDFRKSNNHTFSDFTHASVVQCALISALTSYKENRNTLWAQTLKIRVQSNKDLEKFSELESLSSKEIVELVSLLLDNPNKRMYENISKLLNS